MEPTDSPEFGEPPYEPRERRGWLGLVLTAIIVVLALAIVGVWATMRDDKAGGPASGWSRDIASDVVGYWVGQPSELQVTFDADYEYQILNYRGQTALGEYTITEDDAVEVPLRFQNYDSVWYFVPADDGTLTLKVTELEIDDVFERASADPEAP